MFYGSEGSGKTTQGQMLAKKLGLPHLVSGDLVRKYAQDRGIIGDVCRKALKKGHYVPDSEMFVLWKRRLKQPDLISGWVIDGFPRNLDQARFLEEKLQKYHKKVDVVFFLKIREKAAVRRLLKRARKNPDGTLNDTPAKIRERLRRYNKEAKKILDFYDRKGILQVVDGEPSIEEIHKDIMKRIKRLAGKQLQQKKLNHLSLRGMKSRSNLW